MRLREGTRRSSDPRRASARRPASLPSIWLPALPGRSGQCDGPYSGIMSRPRYTGFCDSCFLSGRAGRWWGVVIMVFGILSAVLGAAYAFVEKN